MHKDFQKVQERTAGLDDSVSSLEDELILVNKDLKTTWLLAITHIFMIRKSGYKEI